MQGELGWLRFNSQQGQILGLCETYSVWDKNLEELWESRQEQEFSLED